MPFLPSLLEYSPQDLQHKLELIRDNPNQFQTIQKSSDGKIYLHLDFVLPEFAANRNVQPGNSPQVVLGLIHQYFQGQKIVCNSHFMGSLKDTAQVLEFFQTYDWNSNWEYVFYVGPEFVNGFEDLIELKVENNPSQLRCQPLTDNMSQGNLAVPFPSKGQLGVEVPNRIKVKIGAWLDLDQYTLDSKFELSDYLLMTVIAGKSGQKLTEQVRANTLELVQKNPDLNFTIDGGWAVIDGLNELNLDQKKQLNVVSYSSFWKELEKVIEK
jgi:hypothetical protein